MKMSNNYLNVIKISILLFGFLGLALTPAAAIYKGEREEASVIEKGKLLSDNMATDVYGDNECADHPNNIMCQVINLIQSESEPSKAIKYVPDEIIIKFSKDINITENPQAFDYLKVIAPSKSTKDSAIAKLFLLKHNRSGKSHHIFHSI
ncbi:MAG: hypothetical protein ABIJ41_01395 [Candidatus Omnitrophota bacterium]